MICQEIGMMQKEIDKNIRNISKMMMMILMMNLLMDTDLDNLMMINLCTKNNRELFYLLLQIHNYGKLKSKREWKKLLLWLLQINL